MKRGKALLMAIVMATSSLAGTSAWADRHDHFRGPPIPRPHMPVPEYRHHHGDRALAWGAGLALGSALLWATTRPPTVVYHEPAPVVMAPPPPVYSAPPPPADGWWYYCRANATYYPYVQSCPGVWERVAPH